MHFDDIHWQETPKGRSILQLFYSELRRCELPVDEHGHFDSDQVLKAIDREISMASTKMHIYVYKLLNPRNEETITMQWFKTVKVLKAGDHFGELALQYN